MKRKAQLAPLLNPIRVTILLGIHKHLILSHSTEQHCNPYLETVVLVDGMPRTPPPPPEYMVKVKKGPGFKGLNSEGSWLRIEA